jgi:hypothetical protein
MANQGKTQLIIIVNAPAEEVAEGDRIFTSHLPWMERTHHRTGEKALISYDLSKAPALSNPMDPSSAPTGNVNFVLAEVYESPAGVADHFEQAEASWEDYPAFMSWLGRCNTNLVPMAEIGKSLW